MNTWEKERVHQLVLDMENERRKPGPDLKRVLQTVAACLVLLVCGPASAQTVIPDEMITAKQSGPRPIEVAPSSSLQAQRSWSGWMTTRDSADTGGRPIIVDHTSFELYDQIPQEYLEAALATRFEFADRSVGVNLKDGFVCLESDYTSSSNSCRRIPAGFDPEPWTPRVMHPTFHGWPGLSLPNEMTGCTGSNGLWTGLVPCWRSFIAGKLSDYDVVGIFPDYLLGTSANSMEHFYEDLPGDYDAFDLLNFAKSITPKMLWWTPSPNKAETSAGSLARLEGFAARARMFATDNNLALLDAHDIFSHRRDGSECRNAAGNLIQCDEWGNESRGGHLTYGASKVRFAQLAIVALAQMAGWDPNPPLPPPDVQAPTVTASWDHPLPGATKVTFTIEVEDETELGGARFYLQLWDKALNVTLRQVEVP